MPEIDESLEHSASEECWCNPYLAYEDPISGNQVWVHRDKSEAN